MPIGDGFVANASKQEVNAALAAAYYGAGHLCGPYNPVVINTGSKLVLIDTGTGEAANRPSKGLNGRFLTNLAAAGFESPPSMPSSSRIFTATTSTACCAPTTAVTSPTRKSSSRRRSGFWMDDGEMSRATKPTRAGRFKNVRRVMSGEVGASACALTSGTRR